MGIVHEDRLNQAVESERLIVGETVVVVTKTGTFVCEGEVYSISLGGVHVRLADGKRGRVYDPSLYSFVSVVETSEASVKSPDNVLNDTNGTNVPVKKDTDDVNPQKKPEKPERKSSGKGIEAGDVDVDKLPPSVKKKIVGSNQLSEEHLQSVLSEIGDAAMRSLRRVGVREDEVYGMVSSVQKAALKVLSAGHDESDK